MFYVSKSLKHIYGCEYITLLGKLVFYYCTSLLELNLPSLVSMPGNGCIDHCTSLTSLKIPNLEGTLYSIHTCTNLKELILSDKYTKICYNCLEFCHSLENFIIPKSVIEIGNDSIYGNNGMKYIICYPIFPPILGNTNVFNGQTYKYPIYVPDESVEAYRTATNWSYSANRIKPLSEFIEE